MPSNRDQMVEIVSTMLAPFASSIDTQGLEDFAYAMGRAIALFAAAHPGAAALGSFMDGFTL